MSQSQKKVIAFPKTDFEKICMNSFTFGSYFTWNHVVLVIITYAPDQPHTKFGTVDDKSTNIIIDIRKQNVPFHPNNKMSISIE